MASVTDTDGGMPLPLVQSSPEEFGSSPAAADLSNPDTPLGAASLWQDALGDPGGNLTALRTLSVKPAVWGDYSQAAAVLKGMAIMSVVEDCPGDNEIKYVKFIHYAGQVGKAFATAPLPEFVSLTLVKVPGPFPWKVWGMSLNSFPPAERVRL